MDVLNPLIHKDADNQADASWIEDIWCRVEDQWTIAHDVLSGMRSLLHHRFVILILYCIGSMQEFVPDILVGNVAIFGLFINSTASTQGTRSRGTTFTSLSFSRYNRSQRRPYARTPRTGCDSPI
jgi:N-formylglutamate amidohydrolase